MKTKKAAFPKTLHDAIKYFADDAKALNFVKAIRWPDGVVKCPTCDSTDVSFLSTRQIWKCKNAHAKRQFSVKVGTVLEDSPIAIDKWLCGFWLIANAKNGISSYELSRSIGVTQKTAWFMLHRIRLAMQDGITTKMKGRVEADETYIGALARNMHKSKREEVIKGRGMSGKVAVMGLLERNAPDRDVSRVRCKVVQTTKAPELQGEIAKHVEKGSEVFTDAAMAYSTLSNNYVHNVIDHAECYAKGHVHTNGLENFWSLLKRGIKGTYVSGEPFHLFRYLDEQVFRYNFRELAHDGLRFEHVASHILGKRLTYAEVTGKVGATPSLPN